MSRSEEALLRRFSGLKIVVWSVAFGLVGAAPLSLYVAFGPADGNPIGLGLLAVIAVPVGGIGATVGLIKMLVQYLTHRERAAAKTLIKVAELNPGVLRKIAA